MASCSLTNGSTRRVPRYGFGISCHCGHTRVNLGVRRQMNDIVTYQLTPRRYREILISDFIQQLKGIYIFAGLCAVVILTICIVDFAAVGTMELFLLWLPVLLLMGVIAVFATYFGPLFLSKHPSNRNQFLPTSVTITPAFVTYQLENGFKMEVPYCHFVGMRRTQSYTLLWTNLASILILPAEAFASPEQYAEFVDSIVNRTQQ
jgi:hypothetical protein